MSGNPLGEALTAGGESAAHRLDAIAAAQMALLDEVALTPRGALEIARQFKTIP